MASVCLTIGNKSRKWRARPSRPSHESFGPALAYNPSGTQNLSRNTVIARRTLLTLALASFTLAVAPLASADAEPPAQAFIRKKQEELTALLKAGKPDAEV